MNQHRRTGPSARVARQKSNRRKQVEGSVEVCLSSRRRGRKMKEERSICHCAGDALSTEAISSSFWVLLRRLLRSLLATTYHLPLAN